MVNGCKTLTPVVVVDLDGTLVDVNTFTRYILFAAKRLMWRFKPIAVAKIVAAAVSRKMRRIPHSEMKRRILCLTQPYMTDDDIRELTKKLLHRINPSVLNELEGYRSRGYLILLATAAPQLYAGSIATAMHFDGCVATQDFFSDDESWHENVGEAKLASVCDYLSSCGGQVSVVMTDHHDDLPLLRYNTGKNLLVNPSPKTLTTLSCQGIAFDLI